MAQVGHEDGSSYVSRDRSAQINAPGGSITINHLGQPSLDLPAPRQLPGPPPYFVNRDAELAALRRVAGGRPAPRPAVVAVLSGPAGTGKTGLALHWAHQVADSYPDGHFFRDLRGYGPGPGDSPVPPEEVLADWLYDVWGLRSADIPASLAGRAGLFRSRTTGRRVLVVLDNVTDADQVRPLIPATGSSLVLVISRNQLHGLLSDGAQSIPVDELSRENAIELLRARLDTRVDAEPDAAELLARYCAYLPLTLNTTAARLINDPRSSIDGQVRRLADEQRRLHRLGHPDDRRTNVEAVFSVSYQTLIPEAQRLFRLLGLHPAAGETAGVYSISRLAGLDLDTTEDLLELLLRENLVGKRGDRYHSRHDLLQLYARHLVDQPEHTVEQRAAFDRLALAYYGCVNHAFDQVNQANPMVDSEFLAQWRAEDPTGVASVETSANPAVWFARERPNLLALVRSLNVIEPPLPITPRLACALFYFLETGGHITDWVEVEEIAARIAFDRGDHHDQARSLRNRGRINLVRMQHDRYREGEDAVTGPADITTYLDAVAMLERSRDLYQAEYAEHGQRRDLAGKATTLRELADLYRLRAGAGPTDMIEKAIEAYREAEDAYTHLGNDNGLASLRLALGLAYAQKGDDIALERAESYTPASLDYSREPNENGRSRHPRLKGYALRHLGDLHLRKGDLPSALSCFDEAITTFGAASDFISQGRTLLHRGQVMIGRCQALMSADDQEEARLALAAAQASVTRARELLVTQPHYMELVSDSLARLAAMALRLDDATSGTAPQSHPDDQARN